MTRLVLHVDLDAFYASVEELDHPEWKGHPLVVGADPQEGRGRGVVATCNYEARAFGVRSAMPISEAWRRCPHARYVFPRFERYHEKSEEVFVLLHRAAEAVEPASIDEAYLDVTDRVGGYEGALALARALQARIRHEAGLSASLGVATSKLVAKIATDMRKPAGITGVPPGTEEAFLAPLPARRLPGVGPKGEERLLEAGVATCADLAALPAERLRRLFGSWGPHLGEMARGVDASPVVTSWERKSVGGETTFLRDVDDPRQWEETVEGLARDAAEHLRTEGLLARTVTLKVRLTGFETYTRARSLPQPTSDPDAFTRTALALLRENAPERPVRLLGVRLSALSKPGAGEQADLSQWPPDRHGEAPAWRPAQTRLDDLP